MSDEQEELFAYKRHAVEEAKRELQRLLDLKATIERHIEAASERLNDADALLKEYESRMRGGRR